MKKRLFFVFLVLFFFYFTGQSKVIENPHYEIKSTGIHDITKIELNENETRVHIHATFLPNWWVKFSKQNFIEDCLTGQKFYATDIKNGEFDKEIFMPASGDSTFTVVFPKLPESVKKINFGKEDKIEIWGISLEGKQYKKTINTIKAEIQTWINKEIAKSQKAPLTITDYNSPKFFTKQDARLIGSIKGYDTRLGFNTGIIYFEHEITRENTPLVLEIQPDGRFDLTLPLIHPKCLTVLIKNKPVKFYLEPGQTLAVIVDWEQFLIADRLRNVWYQIKDIQYFGALAKINQELADVEMKDYDYKKLREDAKKTNPVDFSFNFSVFEKETIESLEKQINSKKLLPQTKLILRNRLVESNASTRFDFLMNAKSNNPDFEKDKVPVSYYDFLKTIDLNDQSLLIADIFSTFINRFEYIDLFREAQNVYYSDEAPKIDFYSYLFDELGLESTEEDKVHKNKVDSMSELSKQRKPIDVSFYKRYDESNQSFLAKYDTQLEEYRAKYITPLKKTSLTYKKTKEYELKDSILFHSLGIKPNLIMDIAKIRSLEYTFKNASKDDALSVWESLSHSVKNPFLLAEGKRILEKIHPLSGIKAYELPEGKGTEVFRRIIYPFKGKYLIVDFWATTCPPCVGGIKYNKSFRDEYKDSSEIEFIFITSSNDSPKGSYEKFIKEQELKNTFYLIPDEYFYLRQLFNFNGIPRYVLIDKEGKVLDDDFGGYDQLNKLEGILGK